MTAKKNEHFHDEPYPAHRRPATDEATKLRSGCVRPGELSPAPGRRHSRLIPAHGRSVTPISRGLANALGFRPGGVLFWAFARTRISDSLPATKHPDSGPR